jgi:hypothetical protein
VAALPQVQRKLRKLEEVDQQLARRLELGGVVHLDLVIGSLVSLELHFALSWSGKSAGAACFI